MGIKMSVQMKKELDNLPTQAINTSDKDNICFTELWQPLTKDKVLHDLAISRQQIEEGQCLDLPTAVEEIRAELGI